MYLGEQHGAADLGAAPRAGQGPGQGHDGQDRHLVPVSQLHGAAHREQGRRDPHLLAVVGYDPCTPIEKQ